MTTLARSMGTTETHEDMRLDMRLSTEGRRVDESSLKSHNVSSRYTSFIPRFFLAENRRGSRKIEGLGRKHTGGTTKVEGLGRKHTGGTTKVEGLGPKKMEGTAKVEGVGRKKTEGTAKVEGVGRKQRG